MLFDCVPVSCDACAMVTQDSDTHDSLRQYAVRHLGADEDYVANEAAVTRDLSSSEFDDWFERALTRQGWPVYKYGRGKRVARCLKVEDNELSWGSKKTNTRSTIKLADIDEVVREPAPDAPEGTNPDALICFIVNDGTGLKVLCSSVTDAILLTHGFKTLIARALANINTAVVDVAQ